MALLALLLLVGTRIAIAPARAADPPELDTFRPSPLAVLGATDGLETGRLGAVDGGLWFQDDVQPWVAAEGVPVADRTVLTPALAVFLGYGVAVEGALPIVLADQGYDPDSVLPWEGSALGRARLRLRVARPLGPFRFGIGAAMDGPRTELLASVGGGVRFEPDLTVAFEQSPVTLTAAIAGRSDWLDVHGGGAVKAGAAQVYGEVELQGPVDTLASEVRGGIRGRFGPVGIEVGVGAGLSEVPGQPALRTWVGLTGHRRVLPRAVAPPPWEPPATSGPPALTLPIQIPGLFEPGGAHIVADGDDRLRALSTYLEDQPNLRVRVEAHMKAVPGLDDFTVSQARADRVREALIEKGISADRVEAIGFGSGVYNEDVIEIVVAE